MMMEKTDWARMPYTVDGHPTEQEAAAGLNTFLDLWSFSESKWNIPMRHGLGLTTNIIYMLLLFRIQ